MFESLNQKIKAGEEEKVRGEEKVNVKDKENGRQIKSKYSKGEVIKRREYSLSPSQDTWLIPGKLNKVCTGSSLSS